MKWTLKSKYLIAHEDGHTIELKAGSWRSPMDIHPKIVRGTPAVKIAQLIREGLDFAYKASMPKTTTISRSREKSAS